MSPYITLIKSAGYRVFIRPGHDVTYCFFTDGKNIGCAQWGAYRQSVCSVHMANHQTGTGFHVADEITAETVRTAAECFAPQWASQCDRQSVIKYKSFDAYLSASKFNRELIEA